MDGEVSTYQCVRRGKALTLTDEEGVRLVFQFVE